MYLAIAFIQLDYTDSDNSGLGLSTVIVHITSYC